MNCHYSAQGEYKCTKPKTQSTAAPAKFSNVYFAEDPQLEEPQLGDMEERFADENGLEEPQLGDMEERFADENGLDESTIEAFGSLRPKPLPTPSRAQILAQQKAAEEEKRRKQAEIDRKYAAQQAERDKDRKAALAVIARGNPRYR